MRWANTSPRSRNALNTGSENDVSPFPVLVADGGSFWSLPKGAEVMMAKGHERGFGFIPNSAIDQHVSERHRERDMEPVVAEHPKLLGIGIDPNTIIVVHQDQFEVLGSGKVTISEAGRQQYSISSGSHFDLRKRKPL
jgi:cyanophycinase